MLFLFFFSRIRLASSFVFIYVDGVDTLLFFRAFHGVEPYGGAVAFPLEITRCGSVRFFSFRIVRCGAVRFSLFQIYIYICIYIFGTVRCGFSP